MLHSGPGSARLGAPHRRRARDSGSGEAATAAATLTTLAVDSLPGAGPGQPQAGVARTRSPGDPKQSRRFNGQLQAGQLGVLGAVLALMMAG